MKQSTPPIITLTTDYGTRDHYVGAIKGVILGISPDVRLVDITHDIEPHNIQHAAFVLRQIWSWYPEDTVHLVIVDPGVGTDRRIILGRYDGRYVVAPDNGLISSVHREFSPEAMHVVEDQRFMLAQCSTTFHGRDIMAPVTAHLANGVRLREFGRATDRVELLTTEHRATQTDDGISGSILYVDRFGTLITNVNAEQLARAGSGGAWHVVVNDDPVGPVRLKFADVQPGEPLALIGSSGLLEIAVNRGSAVDRFGASATVRVAVTK